MNYKTIFIILLILILIFLTYKRKENFTLEEVLQNMASVYEESDGTLSFQNLKAIGDTSLKRLIVNSTFMTKQGLSNISGDISNSGTGGIINTGAGGITNTGGNITNRGQFINTGSAKITDNLEVVGDISGNIVSFKGIIVMWSGTIGSIPNGWTLCDGTKETPDLRSRFIIGASTPGGQVSAGLTVKQVNDISGTETHTLSINEMPAHKHSNVYAWGGYPANGYNAAMGTDRVNLTTDNLGGLTGGGLPHNNMPPYYALAYIMKI
jgi:hypothetical protein